MKFLILLLAVAALAHGKSLNSIDNNSAFGYLQNSIKLGERIQKLETEYLGQENRIIGGSAAALGQFPFQAGLLIDIVGVTHGRGVCGGSLISPNRVITAAHCWFDGWQQGRRVEVVLGSITLFTDGVRQHSETVVNHPNWFPLLVFNDVGVIYLPNTVSFTDNVAPIALPSEAELDEDFAGETAIVSGFGLTQQGGSISNSQFLSYVSLRVISNAVCRLSFPVNLQDSNICTSGAGPVGACDSDSGGPLIVNRDNSTLLVGVVSFGSGQGCEAGQPTAYARVTSFNDFINENL